ncbi:reverse transcriptase domain-containing protein [Tanacetum coccineum]
MEIKYILVAVDLSLSKWVKAKALPTNDTRVVVKFLKPLFARFGTPRVIISDSGTHFCNDQFAKVMSKYRVTHRLAIAYHPQTSGQVEEEKLTLIQYEENKLEKADTPAEIILSQVFPVSFSKHTQSDKHCKGDLDNVRDAYSKDQYVTNVKQNMDISTTPYVQIYTHLKAYEPHAKKTLKKQEQSTSIVDPLAYVAHTTSAPVLSSSSTLVPKTYWLSLPNDALMATMTQIANSHKWFPKAVSHHQHPSQDNPPTLGLMLRLPEWSILLNQLEESSM